MVSDNVSLHLKLRGRMDVERKGGIWKAAARKGTKFRGNAKTRLHGELGINSSGYSPAQWVIGRDTCCRGHL